MPVRRRADRSPLRLTARGRIVLGLVVAAFAIGAVGLVAVVGGWTTRTASAGAAAGSSTPPTRSPSPAPPVWRPAQLAALDGLVDIVADDPASLANATARRLFDTAPVAVVVPLGDRTSAVSGAGYAEALQAPVLVGAPVGPSPGVAQRTSVGADLRETLEDLDVEVVVTVGDVELPADLDLRRAHPVALLAGRAPRTGEPTGVALVRPDDGVATLAATNARARGLRVVALRTDDPRADPTASEQLAGAETALTLRLGRTGAWPAVDPDVLAWQLAVARRGLQLPGGGQVLFPGRRLVALYGNPEGPALGVLGEQGPPEAVARARQVAAPYAEASTVPVVPAFEIIATVASASPGAAADYSRRTPIEALRPWVDLAEREGLYVVLDLQSGRSDFLRQAQEYEELLRRPHVGLALDPEWRLGPGQVHLRQIGSVDAAEVERVADWLADLVRANELPQKLLVVHQFKLSMITDRTSIRTDRPELAVVIQMDGQGSQGAKIGSWQAITQLDPPAGVRWGWKNFYDEDPVLRAPADVLALEPSPVYVSYQ